MTATPPRKTRTKLFKPLLALALLLPLLGWGIYYVKGHVQLHHRIQTLRAQGIPMTLEDLNHWYHLPEASANTADQVIAVLNSVVPWDKDKARNLPYVGSGPDPNRHVDLEPNAVDLAREVLADNNDTLTWLHDIKIGSACRLPLEFTPKGIELPWVSQVRPCSSLLSLEAVYRMNQHQWAPAINSITTQVTLARSINVPLILPYLVRAALTARSFHLIELLINRVELSDSQLIYLSQQVTSSLDDQGLKQALIGERCWGDSAFQNPSRVLASPGNSNLPGFVFPLLRGLGLLATDQLAYINLYQDGLDILDHPTPQCLHQMQTLQTDLDQGRRGGLITHQITPALARIQLLGTRCVAHQRVTLTALALERYRLAQGQLPDSLAPLVPVYLERIPSDPFDGQPLRYRLLHPGYLLYSIGDDFSDDQGRERGKRNQPWDITFIVER